MSNRRRPIVFVDPQDPNSFFWWPAVLLAQDMLSFFDYTNGHYDPPEEGEITVCYLEDGSFSNVIEKDTVPFDLNGTPYVDYQTHSQVCNEKGIIAAKLYMDTGVLPSTLLWLDKRKAVGQTNKKRKVDTKQSQQENKIDSQPLKVNLPVLDPISKKRQAVNRHQQKALKE